jgi:hypothetical protein
VDFYNPWVAGRLGTDMPPASLYASGADRRLAAEARRLARAQDSPRLAEAAGYWEHRRGLNTSPLMAALYAHLTLDDYDRALQVHQVLSLAVFAATLLFAGPLLGLGLLETLALVTLLATAFAPLASDLRVGNVGQIQLGALGLFLAVRNAVGFRGRDLAGGALLGFMVVFKANLAVVAGVVALVWLVDARWQTLAGHAAGAMAGAALGVVIAAWHFGSLAVWRAWLPMLRLDEPGLDLRLAVGNVAPAALLDETTALRVTPLLLALLAGGVGIALLRSRSAGPPSHETAAFREQRALALGCTVLLLGSPLVWLHYHMLAVLPFLVALRAGGRPDGSGRRTSWLALAALAPLLVMRVMHGLPNPALAPMAALVGLGTLALYALVLRQLATGLAADPHPARAGSRRRRRR